jgi:hypothetical protein
MEGDVSHDQITRFLSKQKYDSKDLWKLSSFTTLWFPSFTNIKLYLEYIMVKSLY